MPAPYPSEFRREAVELLKRSGKSVPVLAKLVPVLAACLLLGCAGRPGAPATPLVSPDVSRFNVGDASGQVLLDDLSRDGHLDLITRHQQARLIRVHLGDGRAGFRTRSAVSLDFSPGDMSLGDVNSDDVLDLVITAGDRDVVEVLLGDGRAGFRRAGLTFTPSSRVYRYNKRSLHLVDLNEDGNLDVVTANARGQFRFPVMLGDGRGRLAAGSVLRLRPVVEGYALAFGDVDGDGHVDAVTAVSNPRAGRLDVHLGDGSGAFARVPGRVVRLPATRAIDAIADLDSDRRPDLVLSHRGAAVSILRNRGGGRFALAAGSPVRLPAPPFSIALADLNRDDEIDLIGATVNTVTTLLSDHHAFPQGRQSSVRAGPGAYNLAIGDLNGDGRADVVASSFESERVTVLRSG